MFKTFAHLDGVYSNSASMVMVTNETNVIDGIFTLLFRAYITVLTGGADGLNYTISI